MSESIPVLYAEDNPTDADLTRAHFARRAPAFTFEIVHRAAEFLSRARARQHSILLLDQRLPDMDGLEVLRTLILEGIDTPIVLVTGVGDGELASQALRLGADDYLPKRSGYLDTLPSQLLEVLERRRQRSPGSPVQRATVRQVLLIDDDAVDTALIIEHLSLTSPHISVKPVANPDLALQALQSGQNYDLVICDFMLPGMNGLDLMSEIRRRGVLLPFILVTGMGNEELVVSALKLGASDYILKHGRHYAELALRIELAIDRHRLQLANERASAELAERQRTLAALRESEKQLNLALEAGDIGLWSWKIGSKQVLFSNRWKAQLGYAPHDFDGQGHEWRTHCHPDDLPRLTELGANYDSIHWPNYVDEYRMRHRNGQWRWFLLRADLERDVSGRPVSLRGSQIDITQLKHHQSELDLASLRLQQLSRRLLEVQEAERRHLARELHDEIAQVLTATKLQLQSAALHPEPERATAQFQDAVSLVDRLLAQVRSLTLDLRPPLLDDLGLLPALHWLLEQQQARSASPRVQLLADSVITRGDPAIDTACFRIAQEALTNALRHAQAQSIVVTVDQENSALRLSVRDDGRGFDVETARFQAERSGSLGLLGMHERASLAGGALTLRSSPGQGTRLEVVFPLSATPPKP